MPDADTDVTADDVLVLRKATGLGISDCRRFLLGLPVARRQRVLLAARTQVGTLHDPIEDDPSLSDVFGTVRREVEQRSDGKRARGRWRLMQEILRERYGIDWMTPAEMNPGCAFD